MGDQNQRYPISRVEHLQDLWRTKPAWLLTQLPARWQPAANGIAVGMRITGAGVLATQVAYAILFALPPVFILTIAIGALLEEYGGISVAGRMQDLILEYAPEQSQQLLLDLVDQALLRISPGLASVSAVIFLLVALWGSMSGMSALITATNRAYGVRETRDFIALRGRILFLAILIPLLTILAIVLIFLGDALGAWAFDKTGIHFLTQQGVQLLSGVAVLLIGFVLLYQIAPNVHHSAVWSLPGAVAASLALMLAIAIFELVLSRVAIANIYGAASSVIILLYLFRLIGYLYILGAVINSVLSAQHDEVRQDDLDAHPEKRIFTSDGFEIAFLP